MFVSCSMLIFSTNRGKEFFVARIAEIPMILLPDTRGRDGDWFVIAHLSTEL